MAKPILYYRNNIDTILTLRMYGKTGVENSIFSSSTTVYGEENHIPYNEDMKKIAAQIYVARLNQ